MILFIFLLTILLSFPPHVAAIYDPASVSNNKFGIHIADTNDIPDVAPLINSSGGDWGYVTLVIEENDRDPGKWQKIFDDMRRLHLIPIVRLATHIEGSSWTVPKEDSFREWVDFLSKLRWVVKNRYVILFNEPNHAKEWGGNINPGEYAQRFVDLAKQFKDASPDFFILPAGLDASASNGGETLDEQQYLEHMFAAKPEIGNLIDGWTSHSYPNPGFSGSPYAFGRGSMRTFQWELSLLKELGVNKDLPVFITETGWIHSQGKMPNLSLMTPDQVGANLRVAAATIWQDPRIVAVTPFVFNYQGLPFDHFSWKKLGSGEYYAQYGAYQSIPKQKGKPKRREQYELLEPLFPPNMVSGSFYTFTAVIKNAGEAIVSPDAYELVVEEETKRFAATADPVPKIEPGETGTITVHMKTPDATGPYTLSVKFKHDDELILLTRQDIHVLPPPVIRLFAQLGWQKESSATDVTVLIYQNDTLITKFSNLTLKKGMLDVSGLIGVVPNETYRVVMLVPQYLPRQTIVSLNEKKTDIKMKRFVPIDFNDDGTFTFSDMVALVKLPPNAVFSLFFGP